MSFDPNQPSAEIKSRIKESYDAIADTYNKWTEGHSDLRRQYLDKFIAQLPTAGAGTQEVPQLRILELGCGAGEPATRILASLPGAQVTANDISSRQVALGRENALKWDLDASSSVRFAEGDMMDRNVVDFPEGSLDGVVGLYSIIHLPKDEQAEMLARLAGWLKEGGILLANFSAGESEGKVLEEWLDQKEGWMFWSGWGEGTVEKLQGAGLEVVVRGIEPEGVDVDFLWVLARKVKASV